MAILPMKQIEVLQWSFNAIALGLALLAAYGLYLVAKFSSRVLGTPLRQLRGPKSPSWIMGVEASMIAAEDGIYIHELADQFGTTFTYPSFLGVRGLVIYYPYPSFNVVPCRNTSFAPWTQGQSPTS